MSRDRSFESLEDELLEEKAATLSRVTRKMEAALAALRDFDRERSEAPSLAPAQRAARAHLLAEAGERVWFFVVQRESLGLVSDESTFEAHGIPAEVRRHMGPRRR